jgi:ElaA protein
VRWQWVPFSSLSLMELYRILALRQEVFIVEQDCPYRDADGLDARAHHLLGWLDGALAAYLRAFPPGVVHPEACIGRVITAPAARGRGWGRPLMEEGHRRVAATWGEGPIKIGAQAHLRAYYESVGYAVVGPGYDEDGIPHLPMRRP